MLKSNLVFLQETSGSGAVLGLGHDCGHRHLVRLDHDGDTTDAHHGRVAAAGPCLTRLISLCLIVPYMKCNSCWVWLPLLPFLTDRRVLVRHLHEPRDEFEDFGERFCFHS